MRIAIVRYNAGNIASVANSLRRLGADPIVSDDPEVLSSADKVIFPGVGEASSAMSYLAERGLDAVIPSLKQPVLGICLGMQLLGNSSEENDTACLGIIPFQVKRFDNARLKVPHVGWNRVENQRGPLFEGISAGEYFYFVHGYYVELVVEAAGTCSYGTKFSAAVSFHNFSAVQFHPERSGPAGARLLANFLKI